MFENNPISIYNVRDGALWQTLWLQTIIFTDGEIINLHPAETFDGKCSYTRIQVVYMQGINQEYNLPDIYKPNMGLVTNAIIQTAKSN